jgi:membrane-associated phospholipid phosphatase
MSPQKLAQATRQVTVQSTVPADTKRAWRKAGVFTAGFVLLSATVWGRPDSIWGEGTTTELTAKLFINHDLAMEAIWFGGIRAVGLAAATAVVASLAQVGFKRTLTGPWVVVGAAGFITCVLVQEVLKPLIGRTSEGWDMFPSGHAAGAMAAGALLWCASDALGRRRNLGRIAAVTWAAVGALAPVAVHSHYPTDALGSALCFAAVLYLMRSCQQSCLGLRAPVVEFVSRAALTRSTG